MEPEKYFFAYAFPCSGILLQKGVITQEEYNSLEKKVLKGDAPSKKVLEETFEAAFERIKRLAKRMNKDYWDFEVIHEYWTSEHNKIINRGEGIYGKVPETFKDLCRIHIAKVIRKQEDKLVVTYNKKERVVFNTLVPEAKLGDNVTIHHAYAIEMV